MPYIKDIDVLGIHNMTTISPEPVPIKVNPIVFLMALMLSLWAYVYKLWFEGMLVRLDKDISFPFAIGDAW